MTYTDSSDYRLPLMASERVCSGAGMLCKALLSLKTICAEHSRPDPAGGRYSPERAYYMTRGND